MNSIIEVTDLHKTFRPEVFGRPVTALRGVSFAVEEGACFGYLGQNGAGKTTTLKVLTGLMSPTKGSAQLFGKPCGDTGSRMRLGYLPENPYFYEHLTPNEALVFYGRLSGLTAREALDRAPALLERVDLVHARDRRIRGFSKGMRQRFGLAAALIADPDLLMLDEPLSGLDPYGRRLVKEIVLAERARGKTVFLCSHVLSDVQELCDKVLVIHDGVVAREGTIHDLLDSEPRSFELCAERVSSELTARIEEAASLFRRAGTTVTAHLPGKVLGPELAAAVHSEGGQVLSLVPERETLETWFVRITGHVGADGKVTADRGGDA